METKETKLRHPASSTKRIAIMGLVMYLGALGLMMLLETTLLFPAPSASYGEWQVDKLGVEEFFVDGADKTKIHVWVLPKANADKTLIFCHGNGQNLGGLGGKLKQIRDRWNVNVVAFDFRGYGKTGGQAKEVDILSDSVAVAKWVESNERFQGQPLIALGQSLGGACAVEIATKTHVDGLVLDRTFSATVDVAAERYFFFPVRLVMRNQFRSIDKISSYAGPLLQMHGEVDQVVPYRFGRRLFDTSVAQPKEFMSFPVLRHNDPWPTEFWDAGKKFLDQL